MSLLRQLRPKLPASAVRQLKQQIDFRFPGTISSVILQAEAELRRYVGPPPADLAALGDAGMLPSEAELDELEARIQEMEELQREIDRGEQERSEAEQRRSREVERAQSVLAAENHRIDSEWVRRFHRARGDMSITDWAETYCITQSVLFDWLAGGGGPVRGKVAPGMSDEIKKKIEEDETTHGLTTQKSRSKRASE
jgi:hypothetical protein